MSQYKSVVEFIVRRAATEGRASERQIQLLLEISRQKVESTESLAPVRPETLEYIIEYCVWAFYWPRDVHVAFPGIDPYPLSPSILESPALRALMPLPPPSQYPVPYSRNCLWRGHRSEHCPFECSRCGDWTHKSSECPPTEASGTAETQLQTSPLSGGT